MAIMRWEMGKTFLGGRVTRLDDDEEDPSVPNRLGQLPFIN